MLTCPHCDGKGWVPWNPQMDPNDGADVPIRCSTCSGSGRVTDARAWDAQNPEPSRGEALAGGVAGSAIGAMFLGPVALALIPVLLIGNENAHDAWEAKRRRERPAG